MSDENDQEKQVLIEEIIRRVTYILSTDDYTAEEKEGVARSFFQALEETKE